MEGPQRGRNGELIPVYTEWANHHLLRAKLPPLNDLTGELCHPNKLILLIHSITFEFHPVPRDQFLALLCAEEPVASIQSCLVFCKQIGLLGVDTLRAQDIRNGHLGAILQLLHQLSEYKRKQRKVAEQRHVHKRRVHFEQQQLRPTESVDRSPKHLSKPSRGSPFSPCSRPLNSEQSSSSGYSSICQTIASASSSSFGEEERGNRKEGGAKAAEAAEELGRPPGHRRPAEKARKEQLNKHRRTASEMPPNLSPVPLAKVASEDSAKSIGNNQLAQPARIAEQSRLARISSTQSAHCNSVQKHQREHRANPTQAAAVLVPGPNRTQIPSFGGPPKLTQSRPTHSSRIPALDVGREASPSSHGCAAADRLIGVLCPPLHSPSTAIRHCSAFPVGKKPSQLQAPNKAKGDEVEKRLEWPSKPTASSKTTFPVSISVPIPADTNLTGTGASFPVPSTDPGICSKPIPPNFTSASQDCPPPQTRSRSALRVPTQIALARGKAATSQVQVENNLANISLKSDRLDQATVSEPLANMECLPAKPTRPSIPLRTISALPSDGESRQSTEEGQEKAASQVIDVNGNEERKKQGEGERNSLETNPKKERKKKEGSTFGTSSKEEERKQKLGKEESSVAGLGEASQDQESSQENEEALKEEMPPQQGRACTREHEIAGKGPAAPRQRCSLLTVPTRRLPSVSTPRPTAYFSSNLPNSSRSSTSALEAIQSKPKQFSSVPSSTAQSMVTSTASNVSVASCSTASLAEHSKPMPFHGSKLAFPSGIPSNSGKVKARQLKMERTKEPIIKVAVKSGKEEEGKGKSRTGMELEGKCIEIGIGGMAQRQGQGQQLVAQAHSPQQPNMEKKPMLAVKGISVSASSTTPPSQRRRPSAEFAGREDSEGTGHCASLSSPFDCLSTDSPVAEHRRAKEKAVVGVVSPMLQKQEEGGESALHGSANEGEALLLRREDRREELGARAEEGQSPMNSPQLAGPSNRQNPMEATNSSNHHPNSTAIPPKIATSTRTLKKAEVPMVQKLLQKPKARLALPGREKSSNIRQGRENDVGRSGLALEEDGAEECPPSSSSVPPLLAPTKIHNLLLLRGETQAFPCISSSSSSSPDEQLQQKQQYQLAIAAASTTSQDSLDSVRTAIRLPSSSSSSSHSTRFSSSTGERKLRNSGKEEEEEKDLMGRRRSGEGGHNGKDGKGMAREEEEALGRKVDGGGEKQQMQTEHLEHVSQAGRELCRQDVQGGQQLQQSEHVTTFARNMVPGLDLQSLRLASPNSASLNAHLHGRQHRFKESHEGSSCSSLSSEPFDEDEISTSDLTTASSSDYHLNGLIGQKSPDKCKRMVGTTQQQFGQPKMRAILKPSQSRTQYVRNGNDQQASGHFGRLPAHSETYIPAATTMDNRKSATSIPLFQQRPSASNSANQGKFSQSDRGPFCRTSNAFVGPQLDFLGPKVLPEQSPLYRPYHTITGENWHQIQQLQKQVKHRRLLSPPHNLMVLSDEGDTMSVAAGQVGGHGQGPGTMLQRGTVILPTQLSHQQLYQNESVSRHPAYHSHSLDRHSHLRLFSHPPKVPPPLQAQNFANIASSETFGRSPAQQRFPAHLQSGDFSQLGSLLISPRHFGFQSTFAPAPSPNRQIGQRHTEESGRHSSASAVPGNGSISARAGVDSLKAYSNLPCTSSSLHMQQQKFSSNSSSGLNSPSRITQIAASSEILRHQPGSQLSLASSIGSAYSTIEERYEWEVNKLQTELESYRSTVTMLNQRHSGYNCVLQMFDQRLQTIMNSLGKLQQKRHVKRNEVEHLCHEIEHLRVLSISAGVVPTSAGENRQPTSIEGGSISIPLGKDKPKEKSVERQQQHEGGGKKSWKNNMDTQIRSSFTRAFQKGSSNKKAKQAPLAEEQLDCEQNILIEEKSTGNVNTSSSNQTRFEHSHVRSLKKELENKELALTDVQLDALDKAKEIDILRDTVTRLQHENQLLKFNFTLLERQVRSESRASSHISLNTNCCPEGEAADELDVTAMEENLAEAVEHLAPLYDIVASSPSSGDLSMNTTTTGSTVPVVGESFGSKNRNSLASSTSKNSQSQSPYSVKVVLCVDLSGRLDGNLPSVPLLLPPSSSLASISRTNSASSSTLSSVGSVFSGMATGGKVSRRELSIGHLPLPIVDAANWHEMDQQLGLLLEEYLHRIDPELSLGIDSYSSIIGYQIIHPNSTDCLIRRRSSVDSSDLGEIIPEIRPAEFLLPGSVIRLRLRGVKQNSVDSLVLESLLPRHLLEQLVHQLEQHGRLLLFGPTGIGKSNLARLLAKYHLMRMGIELNAKSLLEIRFPSRENGPEMDLKTQQAKDQLVNTLQQQQGSGPVFVLLDNLPPKQLAVVVSAFTQANATEQQKEPVIGLQSSNYLPFVICTMNRSHLMGKNTVQQLQLHHNFRLFALTQKMDAISGYLGRYLRRRMAEAESASRTSPSPHPIEYLIEFLGLSLKTINDFIERSTNGRMDITLGHRILLQCPLDGEQARDWFCQLWNEKLVHYVRKVVAESDMALFRDGSMDPLKEIQEIWPWPKDAEKLRQIFQ